MSHGDVLDFNVIDNVMEAYKRLKEKYDFKWGGEPFYQDAVHDDKDDVKSPSSFITKRSLFSSLLYDAILNGCGSLL